jgi:hypothetical protein
MELLTENCSPYCDTETPDCTMRVFVEDVDEGLLSWHKDMRSINFKVIGGRDWKLLIENDEIMYLEIGKHYYVPKGTYHKMVKGKNNLILEIHNK